LTPVSTTTIMNESACDSMASARLSSAYFNRWRPERREHESKPDWGWGWENVHFLDLYQQTIRQHFIMTGWTEDNFPLN